MDIVLATHNKHKAKEIKDILTDLSVNVITLDQFPELGDIPETSPTLRGNALLKARTVYAITGCAAIGDDTGLEVDALNGAPGVFSARYAGTGVASTENVQKLLNELKNVPENKRKARFRTSVAYVDKKTEITAAGTVQGMITKEPRGSAGFGYDPVFFIPEMNCTFAELTANEKNKISHRARALQNIRKRLLKYWYSNQTIGA